MESSYEVFTNIDLIRQITQWHIFHYINYPDIFLDIICQDKNIHHLKWLLDGKYITMSMLDEYSTTLYVKNKHPPINPKFNPIFPDTFNPPLTNNPFIHHTLWNSKSLNIFTYLYNNFPDERKLIINSGIFNCNDTFECLQRICENNLDNKLKLLRLYQDIGVLKKDDINNGTDITKLATRIDPIIYYDKDDNIVNILWKNKNINDNWESLPIKHLWENKDNTELALGSPEVNNHNMHNYDSDRLATLCDFHNKMPVVNINSFKEFLKLIKT